MTSGVVADVITVVKDGQLDYRDSIRTSDTSGMVIKMIPNAGNVTDADGNVYQSVRIGSQVWTTENLRTTKFKDGTPIPLVMVGSAWDKLKTPGYCYYNNSTVPAEQYKWGALYNWYTVRTGKLAPAGWHVSWDEDWVELTTYLSAKGSIGKSIAAKTDWPPSGDGAGNDMTNNNASGFSAIPGGCRAVGDGFFKLKGEWGCWWSCTKSAAYYSHFRYFTGGAGGPGKSDNHEEYGFSARLVQD